MKDADAIANSVWDRCSQAPQTATGVVQLDDDRTRWIAEAGVDHVKRIGSGDDMSGSRVGT